MPSELKFKDLDSVLNSQVRLAIVSVLMKVNKADFNYLKEVTGATQGNLSHQIKKLKEAEYVKVDKTFENNYPKTYLRIAPKGKKAFESYVNAIKGYLDL
ncbi:MAG: transcriptional regulator [Flavobacteriales bacterium]|nr:transcriptional regulator [Flavobacteriales bacterium]